MSESPSSLHPRSRHSMTWQWGQRPQSSQGQPPAGPLWGRQSQALPRALEMAGLGHLSAFWPSINSCLFFFVFSGAMGAAYGGSQARGLMGSVAASLCHSHSNVGSKPHL